MQNIHMFLVLYTMLFNVFLAYLSLLKVIEFGMPKRLCELISKR